MATEIHEATRYGGLVSVRLYDSDAGSSRFPVVYHAGVSDTETGKRFVLEGLDSYLCFLGSPSGSLAPLEVLGWQTAFARTHNGRIDEPHHPAYSLAHHLVLVPQKGIVAFSLGPVQSSISLLDRLEEPFSQVGQTLRAYTAIHSFELARGLVENDSTYRRPVAKA